MTSHVLIVLWLAAGLLSVEGASCLETAHAAGILLLVGAGVLLCRGTVRLAANAAGRLWTAGLFIAGALVLSPLFQQNASSRGLGQGGRAAQLSVSLACVAALLLWITRSRFTFHVSGFRLTTPPPEPETRNLKLETFWGEGLEAFLLAPGTRVHIAAAWVLLVLADAGLGGLPLRAALLRAAFVALLVFCLPALLSVAAIPSGQRAMNAALVLVLSLSVAMSGARYIDLRAKVKTMGTLLDEKREAEASQVYKAALERNEILCAKGTASDLEVRWAAYREDSGELEGALVYWRRVAEQRGADAAEMLPVRRILCKMGDSLNSWRRLIYQGFPAVTDPQIAPGIKALGDSPKGDLRAKLLAALVAWEQQDPPGELKQRLEIVTKKCPNEASACNLLKRLGAPEVSGFRFQVSGLRTGPPDVKPETSNLKPEVLWLPHELIVGKRGSSESALGAIEELGEVDTAVVLNEGNWEVNLNARGTPLHEEWPIVRLEFNGKVVGRTQVNRMQDHEVPFTLNVNRGNIYHVKIVFENRMEDVVQGRISRRGLTINGMGFRRGKD